MKIEIDDTVLINTIVEKVFGRLKPLLSNTYNKEKDELFTVESLAEYLHVSEQWVYSRVHLNEIPFTKMTKFLRFRKSEIHKWLEKMQTPAIQPLSNQLKMLK